MKYRLLPVLCLCLVLTGCSLFGSSSSGVSAPAQPGKREQVMEFLDAGRAKAALVVADELVRDEPDDYQNWLTRNAVRVVLRDYEGAQADNAKALEVFEATRNRFPQAQRNYRLAKIEESMALTALIASRRAESADKRLELEKAFELHAAKVKELDEELWNGLRVLSGKPGDK
uniref:Tetratricopeptide repeat protein n=1 Tax=Fundidesulfovibrio putealis TaxID=270496 RepID=A0A7C4AI54_9BACT